jgi:hypothetical protein
MLFSFTIGGRVSANTSMSWKGSLASALILILIAGDRLGDQASKGGSMSISV